MRDEGPSPEDIEQFEHETGYCPECGAEVWDEAYACPACDEIIEGRIARIKPDPVGARIGLKTSMVLVAVLILVLLGFGLRLF